ncbi:HTTM domain-containing protein [Streptomyces boninensis]|uniref:HTTM domain-containing protein n=1 Tax=Streptomyces boninensis TaxID=2039455 RepID=UPI003B21A3A6
MSATTTEAGLLSRGFDRVTGSPLGAYQTALVRIGIAGVWLLGLLVELPNRRELYGPDGPWSLSLVERSLERTHAFSVLPWFDGALWFECCYALSIAVTVCMLLGWRTRTTSVLFMVLLVSVMNRNDFALNAGDDILRIMAIYLVFTRCGQVWSLDARRARKAKGADAPDRTGIVLWAVLGALLAAATLGGMLAAVWAAAFWAAWVMTGVWRWVRERPNARTGLDMVANLLHNGAVLVIIFQICVIYAVAGLYKIQGKMWQEGTAVYYSTQIDWLKPWPGLSDALTSNSALVLALSYGTVFVQVAFPLSLLNRRAKNVLLVLLIGEHLGMAVVLGLPYFSLTMIACDMVFVPTVAALWLGGRVDDLAERARARWHAARKGGAERPPGPPEKVRKPAGVPS